MSKLCRNSFQFSNLFLPYTMAIIPLTYMVFTIGFRLHQKLLYKKLTT